MGRYDDPFFLPLLFLSFSSWLSLHSSADTSTSQLSQTQTLIMGNLSRSLQSSLPNVKWNTSDPNPCRWIRVKCSSSGNSSVVKSLDLSGVGLYTAPNSSSAAGFFGLLCRLDSLESLDLSANSLIGIPGIFFFSNCSVLHGLKSLNLSSNMLYGALPNFSNFSSLETLDLSYNNFSGTVDSQLDGLARLKSLNLSANDFAGEMPALGKSQGLEELVLSANSFFGQIPSDIGGHQNLTLLDLSQNDLSGVTSDAIGNLSKLETLLLSSNSLGGLIPRSLSNITSLSRFAANQNFFIGSIPSGITEYVRVLDLSYNNLSGEIPADLLSSPNLVSVDLSYNKLQGPIPRNLSQNLYRLRLGGNSLDGTIPETIGNLSNLTYLELNDNNLESQINPQIGGCKNLTLLNLASNRLHGELPKELGSLQKLVVLKLQKNNLSGGIPDKLFELHVNLSVLDLSLNSLTGVIPSAISRLESLSNLILEGNYFNGSIPDTLGNMSSLIELRLGGNRLSGTVPTMPANLRIALNLSHNLLGGSIPPSLGALTELEVLDLSDNGFTGEIPTFLAGMRSLTLLNLSNNNLSGISPAFGNYVTVITSGNKYLINSTESQNTSGSRKKRSPVVIIVVVISMVALLILAAVVVLLISSKRFYRVEDESPQLGESNLQIVNGCFVTANSIHRSSIDFSKTMEVTSNPRKIILKTRFSTYYKAVMPNGVSYSIKKLNWTDKIFQMGSHERFRQELEVLGKLSNSNVMVPLAYVLTEDSAYLFYEHVHRGTVFDFLHKNLVNVLDWPSRYCIMLGVAQGLTFLHGCTQPVLLLDLSTKTIHMKSPKEPQIGDIELCKVIDPSKSTGSLSTVAGSVGYIPPEYAYTMTVTMPGNVYSFGVIVLELLTGKPAVSNGLELAKWALSHSARSSEREQILDPKIAKTSLTVRSQMLSILKVALACVSASPEARPKMRNALRLLFNAK
ncbi:hypothetical protein C4D60_Mb03t18520 [Musa balbisiana]|uniref:Protein kinase domain-containing protein n=1 Tax=Musa balbisiana TaxID=52838 RepID=A0A4S8JCL3_MUSBA|nr:hypothetical protein C4D60_Mb03t18520 [Musa balbisiana]